jgi:outer membrane protein assembly factor BamB
VTVCNGSKIFALDPVNGRELWSRETTYPINAGPAISRERIAVPTTQAMEFYVHDQSRRYAPHIYRSHGLIYTQPIATPRSIAWTTEKGHLYVADGETGKARFRLEASGTFYGAPTYLAPRYFYAGSDDGYLYCADELNGRMLWRYSTGGSIAQTPVAVGETVYVVTTEGNLHAVDYKSGQLKRVKYAAEVAADPAVPAKPIAPEDVVRWPVLSGISGIISVSPTRLYCLGRTGQMVIVDANAGGVLGTMPIGNQDIVLHNQVTDRLILGNSMGGLQMFREEQLVQPYVHEIELEKQRAKRPEVIIEEGLPMEEAPARNDDPFGMPPKKPAEDDPFGAPPAQPADDDPFGTGPAKPEPKPADDDPFG